MSDEMDQSAGEETQGEGEQTQNFAALRELLSEQKSANQALREELRQLREGQVRLEERTSAATNREAQSSARTYSRAELRALVEEGKISEAQMDQVLDEQAKREKETLREELRQSLSKEVSEIDRGKQIQDQLSRYQAKIPNAWQNGTDERGRVQREYERLTRVMGFPDGPATDLEALRAAFGPIEALESGGRTKPEPHREAGASGQSEGRPMNSEFGTPPKGISRETQQFYENLMREEGMYRGGWANERVKKEALIHEKNRKNPDRRRKRVYQLGLGFS